MKRGLFKTIMFVALIICVIAVVGVAAGCSRKLKVLDGVNADSITYDGQVIEWGAVKNADYYQVQVGAEVLQAESNKLEYEAKEDVAITITTMASPDNTKYASSTAPATASFTAVGPATVSFADGSFVWTPVEGVDKYVFEQNGADYQGYTTETQIAPVRALGSDKATLRVKPYTVADHAFGVWSNTKTVTVLREPTNIKFNESVRDTDNGQVLLTRLIEWDEVASAAGYDIQLNGNPVYHTATNQYVFDAHDTITWKDFTNQSITQSFFVKITAVGNDSADIVSSNPVEKSFTYLPQVDNIHINCGVLNWDSVLGASSYQVQVCNRTTNKVEIVTVYTNRYTGLEEGVPYTLKVKAGSSEDGTFSDWSVEYQTQLTTAPVLTWVANGENTEGITQGNIVWTNVDNAGGYDLLVYRGTVYSESVQALRSEHFDNSVGVYVFPYSDPGEYYVYGVTRAIGNYGASKVSKPLRIIILQPVEAITFATTDISNADNETLYEASGSAKVAFNAPAYCDTVRVEIDNVAFSGVKKEVSDTGVQFGFEFDYNIKEAAGGTLRTITIQSCSSNAGKMVTDEASGVATVIINSSQSKQFFLSQLGQPIDVECTSGVLSWAAVEMANGYYYIFQDSSNKTVRSGITFGTAVAVPEGLASGLYKFAVAARGNGNIEVTSHYSNAVPFYKLPAPTNLVMNGYTLTWQDSAKLDSNLNASISQYSVTIGTKTVPVESREYTIAAEDISVAGTPISVRAIGYNVDSGSNAPTAVSSDVSSAEKVIILYKLLAPSTPVVNDSYISWSKVDNAASYNVKYGTMDVVTNHVGERVSIDADLLAQLSNQSKGKILDAYVVANPVKATETTGNVQSYYYSSDASLSRSIAILAAPQVGGVLAGETEDVDAEVSDTGAFVWAGSGLASGYAVVVSYPHEPQQLYVLPRSDKMTFTPTLIGKDKDTVTVEIYAMGDNGLSTIRSTGVKYQFTLKKHAAPGDFTVSVKGSDITVKLAAGDDAATYYGLNVGGTERKVSKEELLAGYTFDSARMGRFDIQVRVLGGNRNSGCAYLPSDYGTVKTVHILRTLTDKEVRMVPDKDGNKTIEWDNVYLAKKYAYTIQYFSNADGSVKQEGETVKGEIAATVNQVTAVTLTDVPEAARSVSITIKPIGDGSTVYDCPGDSTVVFNIN